LKEESLSLKSTCLKHKNVLQKTIVDLNK